MNNFFEDIEDIEIKLEPKCFYEVVAHIFYHNSGDYVGGHILAVRLHYDELPSANNIIKAIHERNNRVGIALNNSKAFNIIDLNFIRNFEVKNPYNHFFYDTKFTSLKTKQVYHIDVYIRKQQCHDCLVDLSNATGITGVSHYFYSLKKEISKALIRKYEFKIKDVWDEIL